MKTALQKPVKLQKPGKGLRRRAKELIDSLEPESLETAVKFLAFLEEQEAEAATRELEEIPGLLDQVKQSEKDIAAGKGIPWRRVRRDV